MYLIRLDDACPYFSKDKWLVFRDLLFEYDIKPLVAVIPDNKFDLFLKYKKDENFYDFILDCRNNYGWELALHGFNHTLDSRNAGINPVNKKSEFAGVPLEEQRNKIRARVKYFKSKGIEPRCFVAPAHTFDFNTLKALRYESDIRVISDTIATDIYFENDFYFIPQQCGLARALPFKLTTFCYHPNSATEEQIKKLSSFLAKNKDKFTSFDKLNFKNRHRSIFDKILQKSYFFSKKIKNR